jgi:putative sterol carrier protein
VATVVGRANDVFAELGARGNDPALRQARGTVRLEVLDGNAVQQWLFAIDHGDVRVQQGGGEADAVVRLDAASFEAMMEGRTNPMAAMLRGLMRVEGDLELLMLFQRLLGASSETGRRGLAGTPR